MSEKQSPPRPAADRVSERERARPSPAAPDAFASVLGTGRGSGQPREPDALRKLSAVERARSFIVWTKEAAYEDDLEYLKAEREAAEELGLTVVDGDWRGLSGDGDSSARAFPLNAIYEDEELVGFIGPDVARLLVYDDVKDGDGRR